MGGEHESRGKEPWLAVNLSAFLSGLGQLYSGRLGHGLVLAFIDGTLSIFFIWLAFSRAGNGAFAIMLVPVIAILRTWNLVDAHRSVARANSPAFEASRRETRDPWLGVFLNRLLPGVGQIYMRRIGLGIVFVIVAVFFYLSDNTVLSSFGPAGIMALACYHAYRLAPPERLLSGRPLTIIILVIVAAPFTAMTVADHYQAFKVPTASMEPTLRVGDLILTSKSGSYVPERGDVIVFTEPESRQNYLKRVVALGAETLRVEGVKILIDGSETSMPALENERNLKMASEYPAPQFDIYVPEGYVFVLGDNLYNSRDSRHFGPVPLENVIGRAFKVYWPFGRVGSIE